MTEQKVDRCAYNIKGRTFYQKQLVLGQLELIIDLLKDIHFEKGLTNLEILKCLGSKMPRAMAIVLLEEGIKTDKMEFKQEGKNIEVEEIGRLTEFFANNVEISCALKVIADFFVCTPMTNIMVTLASLIPVAQDSSQTPQHI